MSQSKVKRQSQGYGDPKVAKMADFKVCLPASMHVIKRLVIYNSYFFRTEIRYSSSFSVT